VTRQEAEELISLPPEELEGLFERAWTVRESSFGSRVRLCAISNAKSGSCSERCDFCAQSAYFAVDIPKFPLKSARLIADEARQAEAAGARSFSIVTSGRGLQRESEIVEVEEALRLIGEETSMERCASLGELSPDTMARFRDAGLDRYHHNVETAPSFHERIVHTHSYDDEVRIVRQAQEMGFAVCSGGILGMGETPAQRVEMAFALRDLTPDCVPLNFLDPRPGTPLEGLNDLTPIDCLKIIAVYRLVIPETHIYVCGGRETNLRDLQNRMFHAGASGTMVGNYLTTEGQNAVSDRRMAAEAGFSIEGTP
jgi:biotin synthase